MKKIIVSHSGTFHCDELTAIALLHVFTDYVYTIQRVPHQSELPDADFTIDIGRILDPATGKFDHHQYEHGKSSAGLIWEYLGCTEEYPNISSIVDLIDQNDVGLRKASNFELPRIISTFNTSDIYDDEAQMAAFEKAIDVLITYFTSMKDFIDLQKETEKIIKDTGKDLGSPEKLIEHIDLLRKEMLKAAEDLEFERAVVLRDEIEKLGGGT